MEKIVFYGIILILLIGFLWDRFLEYLNKTKLSNELPGELIGIYDADKYRNSMNYSRVKYSFSFIADAFSLAGILLVFYLGGFAWVDALAGTVFQNPVYRGLLFFAILGGVSTLFQLPFSYYGTFVIEEQFGFNKTTKKTFVLDLFKSMLLGVVLGGIIMGLVMGFYQWVGEDFWLYAWGVITFFTIFMTFFYTSLILPLFNKQVPLEAGELRDAIEGFSKKAGFDLDNIFVMDGSKRSTKANAFFSGFGKRKRIVLFDTLINDLQIDEIVAVLAHEVGHFKKKHVLWGTFAGIIQTGLLLFLLSLFVSSPILCGALGVDEPSFHIGLIAFGILYSPVSGVIGLFMTIFSRKNEYEADRFAATYASGEALGRALKTISVNALSNLTPHPLYVFFHYSHPPLLQRLSALNKLKSKI